MSLANFFCTDILIIKFKFDVSLESQAVRMLVDLEVFATKSLQVAARAFL